MRITNVCSYFVIWVCLHIVVSNTYCAVFLFCLFFALCTLCYQFLLIVHFWLHHRCSLTLIHNVTSRELILKLHMTTILSKIKTFDFCIDIVNHFDVFNMWRCKCALTIWDFHFIAQKIHCLKVFSLFYSTQSLT